MMGNNSFTVLPMSQQISLTPGETYTGKITVVNPADAEGNFKYKISIFPYAVVGENYEADLATENNRSMITKWIKITEPVGEIAPNESKEIEFTVSVPDNAPAGGQYAAITVASNDEAENVEGVAVQNVFEIASIVYATVAGETKHSGSIIENNVPGFSAVTPVTLSALIENNGNIHENSTFVIKVSNFFTGEVILPTEDDEGIYNEVIMPESTRRIERNVSNLPAIGVIKISQTIYYNNEFSTVEKDVIICPIWFMALVLLTLASIVTTIVMMIKKHKKNKSVI
ncbi:hypothetical protein IKG29_01425 [Candidatus Saccharibacteria bacterium]|nr:hypothetical protein [Candidatus Saccharibacteria bacterium]